MVLKPFPIASNRSTNGASAPATLQGFEDKQGLSPCGSSQTVAIGKERSRRISFDDFASRAEYNKTNHLLDSIRILMRVLMPDLLASQGRGGRGEPGSVVEPDLRH